MSSMIMTRLDAPIEPMNRQVYRVRAKEEVRREWFVGADTVAVVGGILVPEWTLAAVAWHVRTLCERSSPAAALAS